MSKNTNTKTPNPNNPSALKPRYEIRRLGPENAQWVSAIVAHSNAFHSPVWPVLYPETMNELVFQLFAEMKYLIDHQIESGFSFGVFDTEYKYKTEEAKQAGGKLFWDENEPKANTLQAQGAKMLEQMDFPLVSVAMSYDGINALDMEKMKSMMGLLPQFGMLYGILGARDSRDPDSWKPTASRQVLMRNATSTRHDYEGEGIMGALARWLMREADQNGYRGIQIECVSDAVTHVWSKPQAPYEGAVISEFHTQTFKDEQGNMPFLPADQRITKCYVNLKAAA